MKTSLLSFLLSALLLLGCNDTPIQPDVPEGPEEPEELEIETFELIQIPTKPAGTPTFTSTETIDGSKGGQININEHYVTEDGDTITIIVKLKVKEDCFSGNREITVTVDDVYTAVRLTPPMVFDKPVELDVKYKGLYPDQLNLTSGNYDFLYIDDNGNTETVPSDGVKVKAEIGEISVKNAKLSHFSRYAFIR
jgi:hypothetical protein